MYTNHTTLDPMPLAPASTRAPDYSRWLHLGGKSIFKVRKEESICWPKMMTSMLTTMDFVLQSSRILKLCSWPG